VTVRIDLPYGGGRLFADVDDARVAGVVSPNPVEGGNAAELLGRALDHPIASAPFEAFLSGPGKGLCIVNDASRPSPTETFLDAAGDRIEAGGFRFLVATGTHPAPSERDLSALFGRHLDRFRSRIDVHEARRGEDMVSAGRTARGTEVRFNRRVMEAGRLLVLGTVEPHYFAGFTGGRKSFLPGCAAYETVEQNHRLACDPASLVCALDGNPVHDDMMQAAAFVPAASVFSVQTVFDGEDRICAAFAGGLAATFRLAVEKAGAVYCAPVAEPADVVVGALSPPLDKNLYQAHKALENAKPVVRRGGVFILVAACQDGIGNDAFARLLSSEPSPGAVLDKVRREYRLGHHKSAKIAEFAEHSHFWAVTGLDPSVLERLFIRPFRNLQEALDEALRLRPGGRVLFIRSAGTVVPFPGSRPA
jgi:lactate racemase